LLVCTNSRKPQALLTEALEIAKLASHRHSDATKAQHAAANDVFDLQAAHPARHNIIAPKSPHSPDAVILPAELPC
jgi:hypothetical protein